MYELLENYPIAGLLRDANNCIDRRIYEEYSEFYLPGCVNEELQVSDPGIVEKFVLAPKGMGMSDGHEAGHLIDFWRRGRTNILLNYSGFSKTFPGDRPSKSVAQHEVNVSVYTQKLYEYLEWTTDTVFSFEQWKNNIYIRRTIYSMMHTGDINNVDDETILNETELLTQNSQKLFDSVTPEEIYCSWQEVCAFLKPYHDEFTEKHTKLIGRRRYARDTL